MSKTIKELAEELNVSKTAIRKKIENIGLRESLQKIGNQFLLNEEQENAIKSSFSKTKMETKLYKVSDSSQLEMVLDILKKQLEIKDKQLDEKDKIIYNLNERLSESQKLLENQQILLKNEQERVLLDDCKDYDSKKNKKKWYKFWR